MICPDCQEQSYRHRKRLHLLFDIHILIRLVIVERTFLLGSSEEAENLGLVLLDGLNESMLVGSRDFNHGLRMRPKVPLKNG